jgi:hypothetical protein
MAPDEARPAGNEYDAIADGVVVHTGVTGKKGITISLTSRAFSLLGFQDPISDPLHY